MLNVLIHHPYLLIGFFGLILSAVAAVLFFEILDSKLRQLAWAYGAQRRARVYRHSYWSVAFIFAIVAAFALWNAYEETGKRFAQRKVPAMVKDLNQGLEVARLEGERISEPVDGPSLLQHNSSMNAILDAVLGFSSFKDFATGKTFLMPLGFSVEKTKEALASSEVIFAPKLSKDSYVLASMVEDVSWIDPGKIEQRAFALFIAGMVTLGFFLALTGSFFFTLPIYYLARWQIKAASRRHRE